jgi:signal peptidase I
MSFILRGQRRIQSLSKHWKMIIICIFVGIILGFNKLNVLYILPSTGSSMEPIINDGSLLLVCRWCTPKKNDIVIIDNNEKIRSISAQVFKQIKSDSSSASHLYYVKRVVALEHDRVPPYSEQIWKGYKLPVSLEVMRSSLAPNPGVVPEGYIWLLGTNNNSLDSRFWGAIPKKLIKGVVVLVNKNVQK